MWFSFTVPIKLSETFRIPYTGTIGLPNSSTGTGGAEAPNDVM
jgi:hypothetical protein